MCIGMANGGKQNHTADDVKMMSKMTDKEIIKALECCSKDDAMLCYGCSFLKNCSRGFISRNALDLINRQQSAIDVYMQENDRLKTAYIQVSMDRDEANAEIERLNKNISAMATTLSNSAKETGNEAIKVCLDRIEAFLCGVCGSVVEDNPNLDRILFGYNTEDVDAFIDNLRKEMVGDNND